ncbi:DNA-directed RNA polymerase subunit RPC12/RpoP [Paenibacillus turicensis]|uniref:DNA-directed RNA polymerase subunit RPC12/RpoP n=1 Tax=Paenibacillus turicensis TaxID=160487 RepID=A0ABS4FSX2_9BACL|nr:hypothetical protein [Paenibacillus turicensis]MBP1905650.1 DNA-directed RNA polymerase subunit RPC12/RpoP [Paenibacillus turicensis]
MNLGKKNRLAIILALLFLVYAIGFALYFKGRGGTIPMWFIGTLLLGPIIIFVRGLISFLTQMKIRNKVVCANCGETIHKKSPYLIQCPSCHQNLYVKNEKTEENEVNEQNKSIGS